jgi:hypothetical protein
MGVETESERETHFLSKECGEIAAEDRRRGRRRRRRRRRGAIPMTPPKPFMLTFGKKYEMPIDSNIVSATF